MKLDFPVILAFLLLAAAIQCVMPAVTPGELSLKLQLLPAVAVYYMLVREWPVALTAALWAGVLTDALGLTTPGLSSFTLFFIALAMLAFRRVLPESVWFIPAICGAVVEFVLSLVQYVDVCKTGISPSFSQYLGGQAVLIPLSAAVTALFYIFAEKVELAAGNTEKRKEIAGNDR